ncbi:hypothetical protein MTR67_034476 [Solanum verrucosum]|uniref:Uncharacterized protein n=1 Tax=Solanum verrucosum TaxID=315347 RepID=A0AAF0U8G0_SOLVR|nr:hypothetical protein MTR67_034476 [Solanum verrucosum]
MCCGGLIDSVSRDRRYVRRSAFWLISSPSCFSLQPLCILSRWAIWYCFTELIGDVPTAPFHRQLDLFLQGSAHLNKRRSPGPSVTCQLGSAIFRPSFLRSFHPPCSFLPSSVHTFSQTLNT